MSENIATRVGWGVALGGEAFDLEDWQDTLKQPFDPWITETPDGPILRSSLLDATTTSTEAYVRAQAVMELMNGALGVSHRARTVRLEGIVEIMADGTRRRHIFAQLAAGEFRCKMRATGIVVGVDGKPQPARPPTPTVPQRWFSLAADDDLLADALTYFGRGDDWFDIYKALECLLLKFGGGGERDFLDLQWADVGEIKRLKRTANYERHARRKSKPPSNPMERSEARSLLAALIARAFEEVEAATQRRNPV